MKILCILYDDPKGGMPSSYPVEQLPKIEKYGDFRHFTLVFDRF